MSTVSRAQALLLSHPDVKGSYLSSNNNDQLLSRIPKVPTMGDSYQVTDIDTLGGAGFISSGTAVNTDATTYDATARKRELMRIAAKVEVAGDVAQNLSMINDVFQQQIEAKSISIWNTVGEKLIYGTGVDPEPAGLVTLAAENPLGSLSPIGTTLQLGDLNNLIAGMKPWDGGQLRYFVMNSGQYSRVLSIAHASGFELECKREPLLNRPVLHYAGVPILVTDWINDTTESGTSSVYIVHLGAREGEAQFGGLVWFYNEDTGAGIRVDGPHRTSANTDILYADLELNIGFQTLSTGSVLRLAGITP